jgi:hypothetical protein
MTSKSKPLPGKTAAKPRPSDPDLTNPVPTGHAQDETLTERLNRSRREERSKRQVPDDKKIRAEISQLAEQGKDKAQTLSGQSLVWLRDAFQLAVRIGNMPDGRDKTSLKKASEKERYENRKDRSQTAPQFIVAKYGHLLNGTFTRADLSFVDDSAIKGLRDWERRNRRLTLEELNLPSLSEFHDQRLPLDGLDVEMLGEVGRLITLGRQRQQRSPKR